MVYELYLNKIRRKKKSRHFCPSHPDRDYIQGWVGGMSLRFLFRAMKNVLELDNGQGYTTL